ITDSDDAGHFALYFDDTYFHCAYNYDPIPPGNHQLCYRRGLPNADGSVTWSAAQQTIVSTAGYMYPNIAVNSNGYPFVTYTVGVAGGLLCTKSSTDDGTWATDAGFPYTLDGANNYTYAIPVPLMAGRMFVGYGDTNELIRSQVWQSAGVWAAEKTNTNDMLGSYFSAVGQDDDVHITFLDQDTDEIRYVQYNYATNSFSAETVLYAGSDHSIGPVITRDLLDNLYVFWYNDPVADHIYYMKYDVFAGTWGTMVDWVNEAVLEGLPASSYLAC
ncbi:unnamed protein product, partial [marine sediment metagenome]